LDKIYLYSIVE